MAFLLDPSLHGGSGEPTDKQLKRADGTLVRYSQDYEGNVGTQVLEDLSGLYGRR